ncbi:TIM barrel protein [Ruminococcus sp. zg-924]|nr:TIM barrel protein [Ruminococcus sp. zg-924]MCQ4114259.1 TIM barrel protein [Ruminococcus sp. zg-921]
MQFGMPTLIELETLDETLMLCSELGLSFVELNMNLPQYQLDRLSRTDEFQSLADRYGVYYTIHLDENLNISDFNKAVADAYIQTVLGTVDIAKRLNIPVINMHMNHGVHFTLPDKKVQLFEQYKDEYLKSFTDFRRMCENAIGQSDIKLCIENTDGYRSYEKEAIGVLLESDKFALTWDIGHSNSSENIDEDFLLNNKGRLRHFHIHDSLKNKDHMALGTGEVDLTQRLNVAKERSCRCVVETKTVQALRQSVQWLAVNGYML